VLKSFFSMPLDFRNLAAGEVPAMLPAGEMWSVVIESPNTAKMYAFLMGCNVGSSFWTGLKKGGSWM
jgi:hypothetical protein